MIHEKWQGTNRFILDNGIVKLTLLSYGARINELIYQGKDLVLGYDDLDDIKSSILYTNPVIGRFANRIADGRFTLNGTTYQLEKNYNGVAHLHGGTEGFDRKEWDWDILDENVIRFHRLSPHMEMGYPGNLNVEVAYALSGSDLTISYRATTDQDTIVNLTNHTYFNLDGYDGEDCRKMELQINAPFYLAVNKDLIPETDPADVTGTIFDFRERRPIKYDYDHCFVFGKYGEFAPVCVLYSPASGIGLTISTDLPGLQLFTCDDKEEDRAGKYGIPIHLHHAIALETQYLPDSPNHPSYPSTVLRQGEVYESTSKYAFWKK